jgi:hypothetical protein
MGRKMMQKCDFLATIHYYYDSVTLYDLRSRYNQVSFDSMNGKEGHVSFSSRSASLSQNLLEAEGEQERAQKATKA